MNSVVPFAGSALSTETLQSRLAKFKQTRPMSGDGSLYLKMAKDGEWSYGAEEEVPEDGSKWAVNPHSVQQGYICWSTNEEDNGPPLDEVMYDVGDDVPPISQMTHTENGKWTDQLAVAMQCVSGDDKGLDVIYKTNSKSGVRELNALVDKILAQAAKDPQNIVPLVTLGHDSYKHKKYGKIYTPELTVVDWVSMEGPAEDAPEPAEEEKEADAPVRRRRR